MRYFRSHSIVKATFDSVASLPSTSTRLSIHSDTRLGSLVERLGRKEEQEEGLPRQKVVEEGKGPDRE